MPDLGHEAEIGAELVADVAVGRPDAVIAGAVGIEDIEGGVLERAEGLVVLPGDPVGVLGARAGVLHLEPVLVREAEVPVEARDAVVVVVGAPVSGEEAERVPIPNVPLVAQDGGGGLELERCVESRRGVRAGEEEAREIVADHIRTDGVLAFLAGQLGAPGGRDHRARVDEAEARLEEVRSLHEEGALLGEKEREGVVDVELEVVGFDL